MRIVTRTPPIGEVDRSRPDVARDVLQTSIGTSVCIMDVEYRSLISKLAHQSSLIFHRATATATRTSSVIGSVPVLVKSVWCVCQGADTTGQRRCHPCLLRSSSVACSIELYDLAGTSHELSQSLSATAMPFPGFAKVKGVKVKECRVKKVRLRFRSDTMLSSRTSKPPFRPRPPDAESRACLILLRVAPGNLPTIGNDEAPRLPLCSIRHCRRCRRWLSVPFDCASVAPSHRQPLSPLHFGADEILKSRPARHRSGRRSSLLGRRRRGVDQG